MVSFLLMKFQMMLISGILISVIIVFICLLFVPIVLVVNTKTNQYYLQLKGLLTASVVQDTEELIVINLKLLFFNFKLFPLRWKKSRSLNRRNGSWTQSFSKRKFDLNKIIRLLKSFKIRALYLNLDTGCSITNAKLYPAFAFLNYYRGGFHINFMGQNTLALEIENRPVRLLRAFINI